MSDILDPLRARLQTALELEHATIPPYFTAWLSIHDGENVEAAEIVRSVMLEEMLHLTLAANVLNAVGGSPRLTDPGFVPDYPHRLPHTAAKFKVSIERFSPRAIETFLKIEKPEPPRARPEPDRFHTIGQFYKAIRDELVDLCGRHGEARVFCGRPEKQVQPEHYYGSGRLLAVKNLETALQALDEIVEQGEGFDGGVFDHDPSIRGKGLEPAHYYRFNEILKGRQYRKGDRRDHPTGDPVQVDYAKVYPIRANTRVSDYEPGSPVRAALERFAGTYGELLATLEQAFNGAPSLVERAVMTMFALKYQGRALMRTPSGQGATTVGLSFEQVRRAPPEMLPREETRAPAIDPLADVDRAIAAHLPDFARPGTVTVRPGYKTTAGLVGRHPAIVVTVERKRDVGSRAALPPAAGGYPVDVRQASADKVLRVREPRQYVERSRHQRPVVDHPWERDARTGGPLQPLPEGSWTRGKQRLAYSPPAKASLAPVKDRMAIVCHVSPEAGFARLKAFLSDVRSQLTVGMYDFCSAAVLHALLAGLRGKQKLSLVLDRPFCLSPSANQSDDQTQKALAAALGHRLAFAWAAEASDARVTGYVFPTAYHIKVAVKDHQSFWLSSGNWNPSNQPSTPQEASHGDRDWHVIVTHPGLARTFEAYLLNDLKVASAVQSPASPKPQARRGGGQPATRNASPANSFEPLTVEDEMLVEPLLTPDTGKGEYVAGILRLIESAERSLYIQTQYVELPIRPEPGPGVSTLVAAVQKKIAAGLDVRIIVSQWETADHVDYVERLQHAGFDISKIRIQVGLHAKGIVVDSRAVAVGSQNWSSEGVRQNRDATLVIHHARVASYFERVFLHDWEEVARPVHADAQAVAAV